MKKIKIYNSFKTRVLALNIIIVMIIIFITSIGVIGRVKNDIEQRVLMNTTNMAIVFKDDLENRINNLKNLMNIASETEEVKSLEFNRIDKFLQEIVKTEPIISQMYVMDKTGYQFYKTSYLDTLGQRDDREYFQEAIKGNIYFSDVIVSRSTQRPIAVIAVPIYNENQIVGVLGASIELDFLSEVSKNMKIGEGGYGYIVDRKGIVIAHPNFEYVKNLKDLSSLEPVRRVINGESGFGSYEFENEQKFVSYIHLNKNEWGLLVQLPKETAFKEVQESVDKLKIVYLIGFTISIILMIPFSRYIMNPIKEIVEILKEIENKNYEIEFKHKRKDEFMMIQDAIESMATRIRKNQEELEDKVRDRTFELNNVNLELRGKVDELEMANLQIDRTNEELEVTIEDLKATQKKLVESEKIASLSSFAAQFAHKINTPIGTIITASSYLLKETHSIEEKVRSKKIYYKDFVKYIKIAKDSIEIIDSKGDEVKRFLRGFKEITLDNVYGDEKEINLKEEILEALKIGIDNKELESIKYKLDAEDISYFVQRGALYTVIFQLISNSKEHAKITDKILNIDIKLFKDDKYINIEFYDDGRGIKEEDLPKIFEPFYKGSLSKENMGIGLSLVYNIVTKIFEGEIICEKCMIGTKFKIYIPVNKKLK